MLVSAAREELAQYTRYRHCQECAGLQFHHWFSKHEREILQLSLWEENYMPSAAAYAAQVNWNKAFPRILKNWRTARVPKAPEPCPIPGEFAAIIKTRGKAYVELRKAIDKIPARQLEAA